jgi:PAS domain S-box-containing protein
MRKRRNLLSIRSYFVALVLSCLIPVCLASTYFIYYSYQNRMDLLDQELSTTASILSTALDGELVMAQRSLQALATSPALAVNDFGSFHSQVLSVIKDFPGSDIILADETGQQLVNSFRPYGSALPKRNPSKTVRQIFQTGQPSITDLFKGAVTGRYIIGVDVPVFHGTQIVYDLAMTLPAENLLTLLQKNALNPDWLITILDSSNTVVARSKLPGEFVGKPIVSPPLLKIMSEAQLGTTEGLNLQGTRSRVSFRRSDSTGWTVLVSAPKAIMLQTLYHWTKWVIISISSLLLLALALVMRFAQTIAWSVQRLITPALALGKGEPVLLEDLKIKETLEVGNALLRASELLRETRVTRDELMDEVNERKRVETKLRASEEQLRLFIEHAPAAIAMFDRDMRYLDASRKWLSDYNLGGRNLMGLSHYEVFPEIGEEWKSVHRRALAGEVVRAEADSFSREDGSMQWIRWEVRPWKDAVDEIAGIVIFTEDITESKVAEGALQESEEKLSLALRSAEMGVWRLDLREDRRYFDDQVCNCLGIDPARFNGTADEFYAVVHPDDRDTLKVVLKRTIENGEPYEVEYRTVWSDGSIRYVTARGRLTRDTAGQPQRVNGLVWDITKLKRAEEEIKRSLYEKEVLLKEIHHRVKNNMQVISSLVALQAEYLPDQSVRAVLRDVTHRVRSMALVHEKLYQSADLARIDFVEYVRSLLSYLWRAHGAESSRIRLTQDLEPTTLSVDTAVPCGLVLNELVSNALEHAFDEGSDGEVVVSLRRDTQGRVRLCVQDNGRGMPEGFNWRESQSLGLRLIQMLAGQLKATVEISCDRGTEISVIFEVRNRQ